MELSFCDLRAKEVINICDGRRLGNIIDLIIDCRCARVTGIVVPCDKGFFNFFRTNQDIFIPWHRICKIGKDVILVELTPAPLPPPHCSTCSTGDDVVKLDESSGAKPNNVKQPDISY